MWDAEDDDDASFERRVDNIVREIGQRGKLGMPEAVPPEPTPAPAPAPAVFRTTISPAAHSVLEAKAGAQNVAGTVRDDQRVLAELLRYESYHGFWLHLASYPGHMRSALVVACMGPIMHCKLTGSQCPCRIDASV